MFAGKLTGADFDHPAISTHQHRVDAPCARFSLSDNMIVERGSKVDWELLHDLHYKAENLPLGPRFWRLNLHGETIGVLVTATPKGLLKERHLVFPKLKPDGKDTKLTNTQRYLWVNQNFRVVSRFVVDTMYRGIGAGYRMMNLVARLENVRFMEIQSSMSKFNIFGQKAGFQFVRPLNANKYDVGLKFFRSNFEASPQDYEAIITEIMSKRESEQLKLKERLAHFYHSHSALEKTGDHRDGAKERIALMSIATLVKQIQQITLSSPMYGVFENPDIGREMPEALPLSAFDWQKPREKLRLGRLYYA
jgi:ABC-type ATPase with predicted acetyltransferase domain